MIELFDFRFWIVDSGLRRRGLTLAAVWAGFVLASSAGSAQSERPGFLDDHAFSESGRLESSQERADGDRGEGGRVYKSQIAPHWFGEGRFWYRNQLRGGTSEFLLVDAARGTREAAFDHAKLAAGLAQASGTQCDAAKLPFDRIEFVDQGKAIRFKAGEVTWKCNLSTYECTKTEAAAAEPRTEDASTTGPEGRRRGRRDDGAGERGRSSEPSRSPNGQWTAFVKEHNVFIKSTNMPETEIQLSRDGTDALSYRAISWSPDSQVLVSFRVEPGERKEVYLIESSPKEGGRAKLHSRPYPLPGDKFARYELNLFEVATRRQLKPAVDRFEHEWLAPRLHWSCDGAAFAYQQVDRGHQRFRILGVNPRDGAVRTLLEEKTQTFIWTAHTENLRLSLVNWLEKTDEIIHVSERDGWRHLYLVDGREGGIKTQITRGEYVVRGIDRIDEEQRQIWFTASGKNPGQDPYFIHYYRVNFDGTGLVALTEADGNHSLQFSPDRKFAIDTWSRVDLPAVHELRGMSDGARVCRLEEADIAELQAAGWHPPEVFTAKGRDGKTDIWGIISWPRAFDPAKKYPVIEDLYAGPQGSFVPKSFSPRRAFAALADRGFIVVKIDGMGTAHRSKTFHDVCWHNLKDAGFEDRILWMKAAAARYPAMDLTRVGVYGVSAGGQSAAGAVLFHPEFYQVAVAACGCHDNRMDKASWNEQWMGYPVGPHYAECSNIEQARRLRGKLLLIVGEMDSNVPPESTLRFADALIKAGKDFDLLVVPGANHGAGGPYGVRRRDDFFVRHLLGQEPPDHNAEAGRVDAGAGTGGPR